MRIKDYFNDGEPPARFEGTEKFSERRGLIRNFAEDGNQDSTIKGVRGELAVTEAGRDELDVVQAGGLGFRFCAGKHSRLNVQGDHATRAADTTRQGDSQAAGAAAGVQNRHARLKR